MPEKFSTGTRVRGVPTRATRAWQLDGAEGTVVGHEKKDIVIVQWDRGKKLAVHTDNLEVCDTPVEQDK